MKSTKILALIVSTIALFPSTSWADEMSINQKINVNSTITGNSRAISIKTNEQSIQSHRSGRYIRKSTRVFYRKTNGRTASAEAISSAKKRLKKQLINKIITEQIINQPTQIDD